MSFPVWNFLQKNVIKFVESVGFLLKPVAENTQKIEIAVFPAD